MKIKLTSVFNLVTLLMVVLLNFSCGTTNTKTVTLKTYFDSKEVSWFLNRKGNNTIEGQAFLRTVIGEVRTCAGYEVRLTPVSSYATERIKAIYGNTEKGFLRVSGFFLPKIKFIPDNPEYHEFQKVTICDATGNFKFANLPDGTYYITTAVIWMIPYEYMNSYVGGFLMRKVEVKNNKTTKVILTH